MEKAYIRVVALVSTNQNSGSTVDETGQDSSGTLSAHTRAVQAVCQDSDDEKFCVDTLTSVNATDPKEYVKTVVKNTMEGVIKAFNMSDKFNLQEIKINTTGIKMALDDCKDLLQFAIEELQASNILVKDNNIHSVSDRASELKNWLGAVVAYQQSCLDGFNTDAEKEVKTQLKTDSLDYMGKLTALALDVVSGISKILDAVGMSLNVKPSSRRLLDVDQDGYPSWMSVADRRLMADVKEGGSLPPNAVVAKDGSGQYKTVQDAINSYPKGHKGRYVIYIKAGIYQEYITVDKKKPNIFMYGDGPAKTVITGNRNFVDGWKTMRSATFSTKAEDFIAKSMGFENSAGAHKHQAVALHVQGDRSAFFDCAISGYQDTLYVHAHRQFYRNCEISGTIDFIFGYASTLIQSSKLIVRKPDPNQQNIVVADGTAEKNMPTGVVIQNCEIVPEATLQPDRLTVRSYLARPWKAYSRAIFLETTIGDLIQPDGYLPWSGNQFLDTCYFAEYANTGAGADAQKRVKWGRGQLTKEDAMQYTADQWLQANTWLPATGIPFDLGFTKA
ncbi:Pectinesterase, catalytic [Sesbania bispinosa]|nr:Pectinesterase, catalytic [Sesbania bispinosa]